MQGTFPVTSVSTQLTLKQKAKRREGGSLEPALVLKDAGGGRGQTGPPGSTPSEAALGTQ